MTKPSIEQMTDTILSVYETATPEQTNEGNGWYRYAQAFATANAHQYGYTVPHVATALAHLSPRVHWSRNKRMLSELLETGDTVGLRGAIDRAKNALASSKPLDTLKGPKTRSFAYNILGDYEKVTVDVHAAKAAMPGVDISNGFSLGTYRDIATAYSRVAEKVGNTPAQTQAIVWCIQRGKAQ